MFVLGVWLIGENSYKSLLGVLGVKDEASEKWKMTQMADEKLRNDSFFV